MGKPLALTEQRMNSGLARCPRGFNLIICVGTEPASTPVTWNRFLLGRTFAEATSLVACLGGAEIVSASVRPICAIG